MKPGFAKAALLSLVGAALIFSTPTAGLAASRAPLGFQLLCLQQPQHCQGGGASAIRLTAQALENIQRINSQVNRTIRPRNDTSGDVWTVGASAGDCEEYVLSKRFALINAGFPSSALRMAHVKTRDGIDHAILIVKTDGEDLVLDNLVGNVMPFHQTSYRVIAVSGADPRVWN